MSEINHADCKYLPHHTPETSGVFISKSCQELWIAIPDLDGYEASSLGRIRSIDRVLDIPGRWGRMKRFHHGKVLRLKRKKSRGELTYLCFYADGGTYHQVNRAVCRAFHGLPPSEIHEAAHLDGMTENNRPENLAWKTPADNAKDKVKYGTAPIGAKNTQAKLNDSLVVDIIKRYAAGETSKALADEHVVSTSNILMVIRGAAWSHVASSHREAAQARSQLNILEASKRANLNRRLYAQH